MLQVIKILPDNVNMSKYHQRIEVPNLEVLHLIRFFMGWGFPYIGLTYCVQKWVHPFWALEEHCNMQVSVLVRPKIWYLHIVCTRLACTTVYTMCMCTCISIHIHVTPLFWSYIFMWNPFGSKSQGKKFNLREKIRFKTFVTEVRPVGSGKRGWEVHFKDSVLWLNKNLLWLINQAP